MDIRVRDEDLLVDIRDDGLRRRGVAAGSGLGGLGDRLRARGGTLAIRAANEGGVRLVARLPLQPTRESDRDADQRLLWLDRPHLGVVPGAAGDVR